MFLLGDQDPEQQLCYAMKTVTFDHFVCLAATVCETAQDHLLPTECYWLTPGQRRTGCPLQGPLLLHYATATYTHSPCCRRSRLPAHGTMPVAWEQRNSHQNLNLRQQIICISARDIIGKNEALNKNMGVTIMCCQSLTG